MPAPHDDRFESEPTPDESQPPANTPEHHSPPDDNIDRAWREIVADLENLSTNSPVEETAITSRPTQRDAPNRETPPTPVTQPGPRDWHDDDEELAQIDAFIPPDPPLDLTGDKVLQVGWFLVALGVLGFLWTGVVLSSTTPVHVALSAGIALLGASLLIFRMRHDDNDPTDPGARV
ncbi:hypothetical protein [Jonesia denitrificans]|uniref:Uncharacterized protein n=1 Tax=Jonesia denitrificans (strain ATCC 14870 / DSM 20603 / BCRC 15368 / CIP 55.134 / JCM 11481 / NBRC 15587 / NCTC 10816 / Prevot 55134) TaxID=471856 RepID=C7R4N3_JONDD|nr:hypothetical protein [Jonesia denitrificans]ACV09090.1 hypothetical protein Jden_1440 [Jonesia denitrificans DSM 20603]ASE09624.1 hypothetical protein CEP80_11135 [Jonesia denitrificans]QXB44162.1 hypothetical protein I6L70_04770 [Jonesia denitrificans]SQH21259.1 Uncharacterised protein [Jonesia denitrificans]